MLSLPGQSVKEPFTTQGYFYKMHLKYIIKIQEAAMLDAQTIATVKATIPLLVETGQTDRPFLRSHVCS
jgi:nitric oxide dioxygenase